MTSRTSATRLTYSDFLDFPDDGRRHELIDGRHYVTPSPVIRHQRVSARLFVALHDYLAGHPIGEVFFAPCDVVLSDTDVLVPDLLVVLDDQSDIITDQHVRGSPALVVEILSPGTKRRDLGLKRRVYARRGVKEYWIVDPERDVVTVNRRDERRTLRMVAGLSRSDDGRLTSSLLPGFSLSLTALFSRAGSRAQ